MRSFPNLPEADLLPELTEREGNSDLIAGETNAEMSNGRAQPPQSGPYLEYLPNYKLPTAEAIIRARMLAWGNNLSCYQQEHLERRLPPLSGFRFVSGFNINDIHGE
jgi:hypothetical protein